MTFEVHVYLRDGCALFDYLARVLRHGFKTIPSSLTTAAGYRLLNMQLSNQPGTQARLNLSGLDRLLADSDTISRLISCEVGLLTNHASTTYGGVPASKALNDKLIAAGGRPISLFAPEHGIQLSVGAGEKVNHSADRLTGLQVHSLYADERLENDATFNELDTLVIDLRDIGVRCFTYAATAARAACKALERNIEVILCDRPNPLGPNTDGPRPESGRNSLLAFFDVPFVHGHTIAELLTNWVTNHGAENPCIVYPADHAGPAALGWTPPSPALSHPDAVAAYAGLVLLEATNISEGRGSSLSFRSISAPGLRALPLSEVLGSWNTGFAAAPTLVTSMRGEYAGVPLPGIQIWPQSGKQQKPLALGIQLLAWLRHEHPDFAWLLPQNEDSGASIDKLFGRPDLREQLDAGVSASRIMAAWR